MSRSSRPVFFITLTLALVFHLGAAIDARAHGSGWSQESAFSVLISFYYADQTPMAYSEVQIFSQSDPKIPYQKGRSDRNGFFSFKPDAPGIWSFSAADGQGHLSQGEIEVTADQFSGITSATSGQPTSAAPTSTEAQLAKGGASAEGPDPLKIVLGLSLIANLTFIVWRRKALGGKEKTA